MFGKYAVVGWVSEIGGYFKVRNLSLAEDFTEIRRQFFPCEADKEKVRA